MPANKLVGATIAQPENIFHGRTLVLIPHMDDAVLGCGGTIAALGNKAEIFAAYATDGRGSPEPINPDCDKVDANLSEIRANEARKALNSLGIPEQNICFFELPDGQLNKHLVDLVSKITNLVNEIRPDTILTPFRFDRHPDHIAVFKAAQTSSWNVPRGQLIEYFVYHKWKLLRAGDIRHHISDKYLHRVSTSEFAEEKKTALNCFHSQTTKFYAWQNRPTLTQELIAEVSENDEYFLIDPEKSNDTRIIDGPTGWIRIVNKLEFRLKRKKDRLLAQLKSMKQGRHEN